MPAKGVEVGGAAAPAAWIARRGARSRIGLCIAAGVGLGLGHSPYDLPVLAFGALPLLFLLWQSAPTAMAAARRGWWAGVGFFGLTLSWLVEPFLVDIARHGALAAPALIAAAAGFALFWGAAFGLSHRLGARGLLAVLALAAAWAGAEYLRSVLLTGFPWALPAYAWIGTPVAQAASVLGPHGLGLVLLILGLLPALLRPAAVVAAAAGLALLWGAGQWRLSLPEPPAPGQIVRVVQPNATQRLKWRPDMIPVFWQRHLDFTAAPATDGLSPPDIAIWPETTVPFVLGERPDLQAEIAAAAGDTVVLTGLWRRSDTGGAHNALAAIGAGGQALAHYDKHHLVPFGEYMPFADRLRDLGLAFLADGLTGSWDNGKGAAVVDLPGMPRFQPLICYEAIFPHEILRGADRPDWLVHITNDAWFGTWSGPYQHLDQAVMRAIEQGLPVARSANTGVSAIIDARGRILASIPLGQAGFVDAALPGALPPTVYARTGDWPALLAMALCLGLAAVRRGA